MQTAANAVQAAPADEFKLIPRQVAAIKLFADVPQFILLFGGARSTKTFTIIRCIINRALMAPKSRHAIMRFRFSHVKSSVIHDTFPKVMALCFPDMPYNLNKTDWFVTLNNGSEIWFGGLDDRDRVEKILGNEYVSVFLNEVSQISYHAFLIMQTRLAQRVYFTRDGERTEMRLKFYCDENPPLRGHWSYRLFIEKLDPETKRELKEAFNYASLLMNPVDNKANLSPAYLKLLDNMPKRQRDRFYLGLFGSENENALWTQAVIEQSKVDDHPTLVRIVIAVDPSGADDDEETNNDDIGIMVAGLGVDGIAYVTEDLTLNAGPATWGGVVGSAWTRHEADRVIGEANYGGAMVEFVVKAANPAISYKAVHASRSKMIRAEPVSALHETGKIKLVGDYPELEDELLSCTTLGYTGKKSPNRLDAFVFAVTELFPGLVRQKKEIQELVVPDLKRVG